MKDTCERNNFPSRYNEFQATMRSGPNGTYPVNGLVRQMVDTILQAFAPDKLNSSNVYN